MRECPQEEEKPPSNHLLARFDTNRDGCLDPTELEEARATIEDRSKYGPSEALSESQWASTPTVHSDRRRWHNCVLPNSWRTMKQD